MTDRRGRRARRLAGWLPVVSLLLVVLASPVQSAPVVAGSLEITPKQFYGGQALTFTGSLGSAGTRTIWLEYHMNRAGDSWTRVEEFSTSTKADGSFEFTHPARSALNISLRVASSSSVTPFVTLNAHEQELVLSMVPADASLTDQLLHPARYRPYIRYAVVADEPMVIKVDTVIDGGPIIFGRTITLQRRVSGNQWQTVGTDTVDHAGFAEFPVTVLTPGVQVYRARAERWTAGGDQLAWYPSFPTYVDVLHRPAPVGALAVTATSPVSLQLGWASPGDPAVDKVWVAWAQGSTAPPSLKAATSKVALSGAATSYTLSGLTPNTRYSFAVFTRTADGVLSQRVEVSEKTDPPPTPAPVTSLSVTGKTATSVTLGWTPTSGLGVDAVIITRVAGNGPAAAPGSNPTWTLGAHATTFTDTTAQPSTQYTYGVYMRNQWGNYSPVESVTVTTEAV
ncbi:MAG TPA: fibronectin type III domain-containing protein [Nocardioidaceae bacterium]|nr:fibronectin type III domain-containing protein [Nocardioidaceae bacterium]